MNRSIGGVLMNAAVAAYLLATGILGLSGKSWFRENEIRKAVTSILKGDFAEIIIVVLSVVAIAAAAFILLKLFNIELPITELVLIILAIAWVVFIVLMDIVQPLNSRRDTNFVDWLRVFGTHLMVLGGILLATERFGGN